MSRKMMGEVFESNYGFGEYWMVLKKEGTDPVHILRSADSPDQAEVVHCTGPSSRC